MLRDPGLFLQDIADACAKVAILVDGLDAPGRNAVLCLLASLGSDEGSAQVD